MFELLECCITDQLGTKYKCPLEKELSNKSIFVGETEELNVKVQTLIEENTTAFKIEAKLKERQPYFGKQRYFSCEKGIGFELLIKKPEQMMAVYQHKDWWLRPGFISNTKEIPERSQLLMWEENQIYYIVLAVSGKDCRADIGPSEKGLFITVSNNCNSINKIDDTVLVMAKGENPYQCIEDAVKKGLLLTRKSKMFRKERIYPELFEYFGWCSWDAFYHKVNEKGLFLKLDELKEKNIPVNWVLIDDGWLDADYEKQKLRGLDGAKDKFPEGLSHTVSIIKREYGIKAVGVWQAIMGYWNGIETGSKADLIMSDYLEELPDGRKIPRAVQGDVFSFWNEWHNYLKNQCGIDFVKVDGQSAVSLFYSGHKTYGKASLEVQNGLGASGALNFNNCIINCMGMAPEDMWNRPSSAISRSSDDFVPDVSHGFREHAIQNSYNSLLQGQFFWGDWDMFYSSHEENWQNSILRAVSGGPVYVSDGVGNTDAEYILPLILSDGKVLRCDGIGMPTLDCLLENPLHSNKSLKIFNSYQDNYLVSILNINEKNEKVQSVLTTDQIPQWKEKNWWVYLWKKKTLHKLTKDSSVSLEIEANNGELALILPCVEEKKITAIGLLDKYLSCAAIEEVIQYEDYLEVRLLQGGIFGFISDKKPEMVYLNGKSVQPVLRGNSLWELDCTNVLKAKIEIGINKVYS